MDLRSLQLKGKPLMFRSYKHLFVASTPLRDDGLHAMWYACSFQSILQFKFFFVATTRLHPVSQTLRQQVTLPPSQMLT